MKSLNISRLPTKSECEAVFGGCSLTNAITRHYGWYNLAKEMGLEIKRCETTIGKIGESIAEKILIDKGFCVERMPQNHPFDLLINGIVKIDVKSGHLYTYKNASFYSFGLGNKNHSCDLYMLIELGENDEILRIMVVPAIVVMKNSQISVGFDSIYNKYTDRFDYIYSLIDYWGKLNK